MLRAIAKRLIVRTSSCLLHPQQHASSSPSCSGVITRSFPDRGFAIVQDALQRDHLFRYNDATSASAQGVHRQSQGPKWPVGMRVIFNSVERANQPSDRRFVAEDVLEEPSSVREGIVQHVIGTMEDPSWDQVIALEASSDDHGSMGSHSLGGGDGHQRQRQERRNAGIPLGYDVRYLVLKSDLTLGPGGADALALKHSEHPLERFRREVDGYDPLEEGGG